MNIKIIIVLILVLIAFIGIILGLYFGTNVFGNNSNSIIWEECINGEQKNNKNILQPCSDAQKTWTQCIDNMQTSSCTQNTGIKTKTCTDIGFTSPQSQKCNDANISWSSCINNNQTSSCLPNTGINTKTCSDLGFTSPQSQKCNDANISWTQCIDGKTQSSCLPNTGINTKTCSDLGFTSSQSKACDPCEDFVPGKMNIECYNKIWKDAGCTTNLKTGELATFGQNQVNDFVNKNNLSLTQIKDDAKKWTTTKDWHMVTCFNIKPKYIKTTSSGKDYYITLKDNVPFWTSDKSKATKLMIDNTNQTITTFDNNEFWGLYLTNVYGAVNQPIMFKPLDPSKDNQKFIIDSTQGNKIKYTGTYFADGDKSIIYPTTASYVVSDQASNFFMWANNLHPAYELIDVL